MVTVSSNDDNESCELNFATVVRVYIVHMYVVVVEISPYSVIMKQSSDGVWWNVNDNGGIGAYIEATVAIVMNLHLFSTEFHQSTLVFVPTTAGKKLSILPPNPPQALRSH